MYAVIAIYDHNQHGVELDAELEALVGTPADGTGVTFTEGDRDLLWKFVNVTDAEEAKRKLSEHSEVTRVLLEEN